MAKLPSLTAPQVVRALKRPGFIEDQQKGSHLVWIHPESKTRTVALFIPATIKEPLARAIILDANLSVVEFIQLL